MAIDPAPNQHFAPAHCCMLDYPIAEHPAGPYSPHNNVGCNSTVSDQSIVDW